MTITAPDATAQAVGHENGSFENTDAGVITDLTGGVDGWIFETSAAPAPVFEIVDDVAQDGAKALKVVVNGVGANPWSIQAVADSIRVVPGQTYVYSVWARTASGEATAAFTVGNYSFAEYFALRDNITLTDEWQQFTGMFTVNDGQTYIRAPIHVSYAANAGRTIYIDNLRIVDPNVGVAALVVEAESGVLGSEFDTATDDGATYISITTNFDETTGSGEYPGANRTASYEVTFPDSGRYELYARIRVGAETFDDDSFFYGSGFGAKDPADGEAWTTANGLAAAGYTEPDEYVEAEGTAGSEVWKWVNLSENAYQGEVPDTFVVEPGNLTQTFEVGAREDGLWIDKFAWAPAHLYYTVANLDNGEPGVLELPGDTIPEPTGPPLADGLDRFLGNIYSPSQTEDFEHYWNYVIPENAGKWGSVEGTRDQMNWGGLDAAYALAQDNGFPFNFHVLVWGAQQPGWISGLDPAEQLEEIEEWFRAVAERYPDIDVVQVVNEPLPGHNPPDGTSGRANYIEALGGAGDTGWDWVINAFAMADTIFAEDARLMINDYGILGSTSAANQYVEIIELLQARGLIDVIGVQGHAFSTRRGAPLDAVLDILGATGLPVQVTEMDVDGDPNATGTLTEAQSDQNQLADMQRIFPALWEHEAVEGITLWGWRPGLWRTSQEAYLVRDNGEERPALMWLRDYLDALASPTEGFDVPERFALHGNYPNPFHGSTTIAYEVDTPGRVRLRVYNTLGQHVATLVDREQAAGRYEARFEAAGLASGVYVYRIEAGSTVLTRRMTRIK